MKRFIGLTVLVLIVLTPLLTASAHIAQRYHESSPPVSPTLNAAKQQLNAPQAQFERPEGIHPVGAIERSRRLLPDPVEAAYKLTFTNKEIDHQTDLHYFGARYYHADLPRFISPDPVSGNVQKPLSWNRYLYCRLEKAIFQGKCWNDPVNFFDFNGKWRSETHREVTKDIAIKEGMSKQAAAKLGAACEAVDRGSRGPFPGQTPGRHFNTNKSGKDSRIEYAEESLELAKQYKALANTYRKAGNTEAADNLTDISLGSLGAAIHSAQDVSAHTDDNLSDLLAFFGIKGHLDGDCDNPDTNELGLDKMKETTEAMIRDYQESE